MSQKAASQELTIKEALEQGYTCYLFTDSGFQSLQDISEVDDEDLARPDIRLVDKEPYSPDGMSSKDIAELLADRLEDNHSSESGDDTLEVYNTIKELDF